MEVRIGENKCLAFIPLRITDKIRGPLWLRGYIHAHISERAFQKFGFDPVLVLPSWTPQEGNGYTFTFTSKLPGKFFAKPYHNLRPASGLQPGSRRTLRPRRAAQA